MKATLKPICHCTSYRFPHRAGGGKCRCAWHTIKKQNPYVPDQPITWGPEKIVLEELCSACGQPADAREVDFGIGAYEFWGACGVHKDWQTVSECCEAPMMENTQANTAKMGIVTP